MKKKVGFYAMQQNDNTSFYRASGVLPFMNSDDFELVDLSIITSFTWATFCGLSVIVFQRPFAQQHCDMIMLAKDLNIKVILDYDDNLFEVDMYNPTYEMYKSSQATLSRCIAMADEIWVSTPSIKGSISHHNVHVIPNAHNDFLFPVSKKRQFNYTTKKVFWRGGTSHQSDVMQMANDLVRVINDNKDWTFTFMGDRFTYLEQQCGDNYAIVKGMPITSYFKYLMFDNPNIGIFPLCNTKFNAGKSNISWLEMSYAGAAFFGNTELPEFSEDTVLPVDKITNVSFKDMDILEFYNRTSWGYIEDNLLLSQINKTRVERLTCNL